MKRSLKIATRESQLALWQANFIRCALLEKHPHLDIELLPMRTTGDKFLKDSLQRIGGKGHFVKELEEALLDGRADLAVHSMKDVPTLFPEGLSLPVICKRASPYDAFIANSVDNLRALPEKAIVGTVSLRRQAQVLAIRPDLQIKILRGNVQTRLSKLARGEFDAILLAEAGLQRLQLQKHIKQVFSSEEMLPACGQGALGIECRADDKELQELLSPLHHLPSAHCVAGERQVNALMGGTCHAPIAVLAELQNPKKMRIRARIFSTDGRTILSSEASGSIEAAFEIAEKCATSLKTQGGLQLIEKARQSR